MRKFLASLVSTTTVVALNLSSVASAQDYPYDDYSAPSSATPQLKKKKEYDADYKVPVERPRNPRNDLDAVFGLNLQAGGTFTFLQSTQSNVTTKSIGPGYTIALGFGWDLQHQPISIEIESGFQQNLLGTQSKFSAVPLKFSTYYWTKLSPSSVIRLGGGPSLDFRMQSGDKGVFAGWNLSMIYEYESFTFEPALEIMRFHSGDSLFMGALYLGYRI